MSSNYLKNISYPVDAFFIDGNDDIAGLSAVVGHVVVCANLGSRNIFPANVVHTMTPGASHSHGGLEIATLCPLWNSPAMDWR